MDLTKGLIIGSLVASSFDAGSTYLATSAGAREANPLFKTPNVVAVEKVAIGAAQAAWTARLAKDHPKAARWIAIGGIIGYGALGVHNMRVYRQMKNGGK